MKTNSSPGELSKNITANSTMNLWLDCGSHCQEYGAEPGSGEGDSIEFCDVTDVQQPNKRQGCPMEKGGAILSYEFFVWDMFLNKQNKKSSTSEDPQKGRCEICFPLGMRSGLFVVCWKLIVLFRKPRP